MWTFKNNDSEYIAPPYVYVYLLWVLFQKFLWGQKYDYFYNLFY